MPDLNLPALWEGLCIRSGALSGCEALCTEVAAEYGKPAGRRHYHTLEHVAACLSEFEPVRRIALVPNSVEFALWLHDVVYDPEQRDNEIRSAEFSSKLLRRMGLPESFVRRVERLILQTATHQDESDLDTKIVNDIDLAIFGKPWPVFDRYETQIRKEYEHVPENRFRDCVDGRPAILRDFLKRPRIYMTDHFHRLYEETARENLSRSVHRLFT